MPAPYATWADVPTGERNMLMDLRNQWEPLVGYQIPFDDTDLLRMANMGVMNLADIGNYFGGAGGTAGHNLDNMQWAVHGLTKEAYSSLSTTFGSEYQRITGQTISADALNKAFTSGQTGAGGLLTGSQYAAQLMSDKSIQDTYGWVKYGMDYSQFQQHKQQMTEAYGGAPSDQQAVQALQYWHQNQTATAEARAQPASQAKNAPPTPGDQSSVIR